MRTRFATTVKLLAVALLGTSFAPGLGGQQSRNDQPAAHSAKLPIALEGGETGQLLRQWYSKGTAAGNMGDYYDNRDGGHSMLDMTPYPQLLKIEYMQDQIESRDHWGMQRRILPHVVFGNSSTSASARRGGSIIRSYYADPRGLAFLFTQYLRNNLYIYPEHQDYDPGHNGNGGYGDLFPTNTPYLIASQGSSGSDQPFMRAIPFVLAAFKPEVKKKLVQSGLLMPTIQMILRITNRSVAGTEDYLTGKAHPTVFRGSDVDPLAMVEMAHRINTSDIPPLAALKVLKEDAPVQGIEYFEPELTENLADTPGVIARVFRGTKYFRKVLVSAEKSIDLNNRSLKYEWVVLRGDPAKIAIEYKNASRSVAEITVAYQGRRPISSGSSMESNRIDIGVFVHNGVHYSPPAFITFYTLDNEARTYRSDGKPLEIAYGAGTSSLSVSDWKGFFNALASSSGCWSCGFLKSQFAQSEISALSKVSEEFSKVHAAVLEAKKSQIELEAKQKIPLEAVKALQARKDAAEKNANKHSGGQDSAVLASISEELRSAVKAQAESAELADAAGRAAREAQSSEDRLLANKLPELNRSAAELVEDRLKLLLRNPDFWSENGTAIERLCNSAGKEDLEAFRQIQKTLVLFGVAENRGDSSFRLRFLRDGIPPLAERITDYEQGMVERFNATVLGRIVFPGILRGEYQENFVDQRIISIKEWRDVYRYASDGTLLGWRRYQADGIKDFNAEGLLVLQADSRGRCTRARVVRYELESLSKSRSGGLASGKVKMVPTDTIRSY